jgi:PTS system nitrogen regulatory IIA component
MELMELFETENITVNFFAKNKDDALRKLSDLICRKREFLKKEEVFEILKEREELGSTGIGNEVAIPHGKINMSEKIVGAIAISPNGVDFDAIDGKPVKIFFSLLTGADSTNLHLKILAKISRLLMDEDFRKSLLSIGSEVELKNLLKNR